MCFSPLYRYPAAFPELLPMHWLRMRWKKGAVILREPEVDSVPEKFRSNLQQIGCGQCAECRMKYAREWAVRIMLEKEYCEYPCWMATLTYDDDHLPPVRHVPDPDTGVVVDRSLLVPDDLSAFIKRLRTKLFRAGRLHTRSVNFNGKQCELALRFYGCGEYGEKNGRPHLHVILLNIDLPDVVPFGSSKSHLPQFFSQFLHDAWGKGRTALSEVTAQSASYVARYVMKKMTGRKASGMDELLSGLDDSFGYQTEFVRMSRMPGIGFEYFCDHKDDIYTTDSIYLKFGRSVRACKPPRYYDDLFDLDEANAPQLEMIKLARQNAAKAAEAAELQGTDLTAASYRAMREKNHAKKIKFIRDPDAAD